MRRRTVGVLVLALGGCYSGVSGAGSTPDTAVETQSDGDEGPSDGGSEGSGGDDADDGVGVDCDPDQPPSVAPMRRLTRRQHANTIADLAVWIVGASEAEAIMGELELELSMVPDEASLDYRALDQELSQAHVDGYYYVARGVGAALTESDARLQALAGDCAMDGDASNDAACVREFVARFGRRAFRRPLDDDEVTFYARDATGSTDGVEAPSFAERIAVMLMVPDFAYLVEDDEPATDDDLFPLSAFEAASRLSYHFWQSMPDEALLAAAEDGTLETDAGWVEQVERVFEDPRTARTIDQFTAEWLYLERVPELDALLGNPAYDAFVGDDVPSPDLRLDMIEEVQALFRHYASTGSLDDVLQTNLSFAASEELAAIYGVAVWDEQGEPPVFADGERGGLLTRAAMVATGSTVTHPILKGKLVRTRVLCDELPSPPADVPPPPMLDPESTIREQVEALTEAEGTSCLACHVYLNGLGYVTENYDGLGRLRTHERVFDEQTGELIAELPVDTVAVPRVEGSDDTEVASGIELGQRIAESGLANACLARQYFRFAYGRIEDDETDGCAMQSLHRALVEGGSLRAMLLEVAMQPEFRLRYRGKD